MAGLATSLGVSLLLFPYLIMDWEGLSAADLNRVLRILVYYLASFILGRVVMEQRREQQRARGGRELCSHWEILGYRRPRHEDAAYLHRGFQQLRSEEAR